MRLFPCLALLSLMGLVACQAVALTQTPTASPSPLPSSTPLATPSATLRPPSPTPEPLLLEGRVTAPLNIRRDPSTTAEVLATLSRGETVQADLQSQDGQWYRIRHAGAPEGFGWVSARYLELTLPASAPTGMTWGRVTQRLNVRSGPGTSFESLGVLETQSPVLLTGKNRTASWLCIQYPFGTKGSGWVAAQYVKADDLNTLPTLDESGRPLRLETPEAEAQLNVPTPTLAPAPEDGDSASSPAVRFRFSPQESLLFVYSGQVSSPEGDPEDWLEFIPFSSLPGRPAFLQISLECEGNSAVLVEFWQDGIPRPETSTLTCENSFRQITFSPGQIYQIRIQALAADTLRWTAYRLKLKNLP